VILTQEAAKCCTKNDVVQDEPERVVRAVQGGGYNLRKRGFFFGALYVLCRIFCDGNWMASS
jgi:hypothetical protein